MVLAETAASIFSPFFLGHSVFGPFGGFSITARPPITGDHMPVAFKTDGVDEVKGYNVKYHIEGSGPWYLKLDEQHSDNMQFVDGLKSLRVIGPDVSLKDVYFTLTEQAGCGVKLHFVVEFDEALSDVNRHELVMDTHICEDSASLYPCINDITT